MSLVLLDVNGILGLKTVEVPKELEYIKCKNYNFVVRPGIRNFLTELRDIATVGIFSSTRYMNVSSILYGIDPDFKKHFSPIMDRSMTCFDPDGDNFETIKSLEIFWNNPIYNAERKWNSDNTLLVDNDLSKIRFNSEKNVLVAEEYSLTGDDDLNLLLEKIREKIQ